MVIFWNFAGVPFVSLVVVILSVDSEAPFQSYVYSVVYMASHDPSKYHFSTSTYVAMFSTLLTAYYMYALRVCKSYYPNRFVSAGTLPCHRRVDSRCKLRVSSTIAKPSLNFHGVPLRTPPSSRPPMGKVLSFLARYRDLEVAPVETGF